MPQIPRFQQADIGGAIQRGGQIAANVISSIPGLKQQADDREAEQRQFAAAAKAASQDWNTMTAAYSGVRETLDAQLSPLVEQKIMTEQEKQTQLKAFRMPVNADKKNPGAYITELNGAVKSIMADAKSRVDKQAQQKSQGQVGSFLGEQLAGREARPAMQGPVGPEQTIGAQVPAGGPPQAAPSGLRAVGGLPEQQTPGVEQGGFTEQDIQRQPAVSAISPAQSQLDVAKNIPQDFTPGQTQQLSQDPRFKSLPTAVQAQKQKVDKTIDDLEREYKQAQISLSRARKGKIGVDIENSKKRVQLSEDVLKKGYDILIAPLNVQLKQLQSEQKTAEEPDQITGEIDVEELNRIESEKLTLKRQIDDLTNTQKMVGAVPGETRTFKGGGSSGGKPPPIEPPKPTVTVKSMSADRKFINLSDGRRITVEEAKLQGFVE